MEATDIERTQDNITIDIEYCQERLKELKTELKDAKIRDNIQPLWIHDKNKGGQCEMVGFVNFTKGRLVLKTLYDGKTVLLCHEVYKKYIVCMNSQRNRFNVKCTSRSFSRPNKITEDNILDVIMRWAGDWYLVNDPSLLTNDKDE